MRLSVEGKLISEPYVELTLSLMKQFGVVVDRDGNDYIVPEGVLSLARPICR